MKNADFIVGILLSGVSARQARIIYQIRGEPFIGGCGLNLNTALSMPECSMLFLLQ